MNKNISIKLLAVITVLALLPISQVLAAPALAVGEGTITAIVMETDPATAVTTVVVTLEDSNGLAQMVTLSLESAVAEGLVIPDSSLVGTDVGDIVDPTDPTIILASGVINSMEFMTDPAPTTLHVMMVDPAEPLLPDDPLYPSLPLLEYNFDLETAVFNNLIIVDETMIGSTVAFDPAIIQESTEYGKVVSKVGSFFNAALGTDYATLQGYQDDGFGYGEIVQASWMAYLLGGDAATLDEILAAKASGDFSAIVLPDGSTATNWGQLRKAVLTDPKQNVGQIISGKAEPLPAPTEVAPTDVPTEAPTEVTTTSSSQAVNGNGNANSNSTDKSNNGNANGNSTDKTNNGKKP